MRNPSASEWTIAALVAASVAVAPRVARAEDKAACSAAYEQTQALRQAGKLTAARKQAAVCVRDACAEFIRTDCVKWLAEIDASQPTVVFEVRDASGNETLAVRVELDGKPWLDALGGTSKAIDPGQHDLHYVLATGGVVDQTVQIREGEKNRKLVASFQVVPRPPHVGEIVRTPGPKGAPAPAGEAPRRSVAPWIIGGVGVAALAAGGVLAGVVAADRSKTKDPSVCDQTTLRCTAAGLSAANQGRTLGPVSTAAFIAGGVGVAAATVWLVVRPSAKAAPAAVGMGPVVSPSGAQWRLQGSW